LGKHSPSNQDRRGEGTIPLSRRSGMVCMIGVLLVALGLRLWGLDAKGVWQDEIFTAAIASPENSLTEVASIPLYNTDLPAPPLYFLITHLLLLVGDKDFLLRFPALVFGILGVAVTYPLGTRLLGRTEGLVGAFLLAVAPLHVRYSQDARFYALLAFLSVLSLYALHRSALGRDRAWFAVLVVATVANLYNHLFAFLVLGAEILFIGGLWAFNLARAAGSRASSGRPTGTFPQLGRGTLLAVAISLVIIALAYSPMVPHLWRGVTGEKGLELARAGRAMDPALFARVVDSWGLGSGWRILILLAPFVLGVIVSAKSKGWTLWLVCCWILAPLAVLLVVPAGHGIRPRYVLFMLPLYLVFAARGLTGLANLARRWVGRSHRLWGSVCLVTLVGLVVLATLPALVEYYQEDRVDWRGVSALVAELVAPADVIVSPGPFPSVAMPRYEKGLEEETFVVGGCQKYLDGVDEDEGGVWFVGNARKQMKAIDEDLTAREDLFFKVVFEVDPRTAARARTLEIAPMMYVDLWVIYLRKGLDLRDLEERYRQALQVVPDGVAASIHVTLGDLLRSEGELEDAITEYQEAALLDPRAPEPHHGLAKAYKAQGLQEPYETEWRIYEELSAR
jgi:mannosyltransferase